MGARWTGAAGLGWVLLVGCGVEGPQVYTEEPPRGALRLTVTIGRAGVDLTEPEMREAGELVFLNADTLPHRVLFGTRAGEERCRPWSGPLLAPGQRYPFTVPLTLHGCTFQDEQAPEDVRFQGTLKVHKRQGRPLRNR